MQIWPDADLANAHRHGVTAYAVTAWDPNATLDSALEGLMYWHLMARKHPNLGIAHSTEDIRKAKQDGKAALVLASMVFPIMPRWFDSSIGCLLGATGTNTSGSSWAATS